MMDKTKMPPTIFKNVPQKPSPLLAAAAAADDDALGVEDCWMTIDG